MVSVTEAYQFWAHPFGLSSVPQIFMMVQREVSQYVHHLGIKFDVYLNDLLIPHCDPDVLFKHFNIILSLAKCLAWLVNLKKSDLVPSQKFVYLGLDFDKQLALGRPSLKRVDRLEACIHLFLWWPCQLTHAMLWLLGIMVCVVDLTHLGRLHTRPVQFCLLNQWSPHCNLLEARVLLDWVVLTDLPRWWSQDKTRNSIPLHPWNPLSH